MAQTGREVFVSPPRIELTHGHLEEYVYTRACMYECTYACVYIVRILDDILLSVKCDVL